MYHKSEGETISEEEKTLELSEDFQRDSWLLLKGVCDLHVYCLPCVYMRLFDEIEMARQMRAFGYRGFVSKRHHCCNADTTKL